MTADWMGVLEAIADGQPELSRWGSRVLGATVPLFEATGAEGVALSVVRHSADCTRVESLLNVGTGCWSATSQLDHAVVRFSREFGPQAVKALYYPPRVVSIQSELTAQWPAESREFLTSFRRRFGLSDSIGAVVQPLPGEVVVVCTGHRETLRLSARQRRLLTLVALHLASGYRLRARSECVLAVVRPDGRVLHRGPGAPADQQLVSHIRRVERARAPRERRDPEALWLWHALIDGRASVIERVEGTKRLYLVVDNAPLAPSFQRLSPAEVTTLTHAARGATSKEIAYALGVSQSAVSLRLASAAEKVGLSTRTELVRLAALLLRDPRAEVSDAHELTGAERELLPLVAQGLSNRAIANMRQRSVRTIANQVASLLKKTGSASRRALATRVAGHRFLQ